MRRGDEDERLSDSINAMSCEDLINILSREKQFEMFRALKAKITESYIVMITGYVERLTTQENADSIVRSCGEIGAVPLLTLNWGRYQGDPIVRVFR